MRKYQIHTTIGADDNLQNGKIFTVDAENCILSNMGATDDDEGGSSSILFFMLLDEDGNNIFIVSDSLVEYISSESI